MREPEGRATGGAPPPGRESSLPIQHKAVGFRPPANCRRILIVGAGGFGREVLQWLGEAWPEQRHLVAGFLSDDPRRLDGFACDLGIVGPATDFDVGAGDYLVLAIGVPFFRRRVAESLRARGGRFLTLVHPRAVVATTARLGEGCVICPYAVISDNATCGRCVLANYHSSIGHDATAGDFAVFSPYATLGGAAHVDAEVFLGLHASVGPNVTVGARSKVSANSCVLSNAAAESLVYGVPGRISPRVSTAVE
jgi:sugar O-acyltransferase (sialic acid O-acetyltransferase NeuD family)